jgi:hypothetical protein
MLFNYSPSFAHCESKTRRQPGVTIFLCGLLKYKKMYMLKIKKYKKNVYIVYILKIFSSNSKIYNFINVNKVNHVLPANQVRIHILLRGFSLNFYRFYAGRS